MVREHQTAENYAMGVLNTGLSVVYSPEETVPLADIVFVHGLQGHPRNTWTTRSPLKEPTPKDNSRKAKFWGRLTARGSRRQPTDGGHSDDRNNYQAGVFWPLDLLPEDCPDCRILTFGYDSLVTRFFAGPANQNSIHGHSKDLLYALGRSRGDCQGRFIIFVAHSLGADQEFLSTGILAKELLRRAAIDEDTELVGVRNATKAIIFLGTPHRGSSMAPLGETMRKIVATSGFDTNDKNIRALRFDSTKLEVSREDFMRQWRQERFVVRTFQESQGYKGFNGVVMDISSLLDDPREHAEHINANHVDMCRFTGRGDPGYQQVGGELRKIVDRLRQKLSSEEQECLRSLCIPEVDMWEYSVSQDVQNTCTWLFDMPEYRAWKDLSDLGMKCTLLWVKGKPGAGKSTLVKIAMSRLWNDKAKSPSVKLAFLFNAHGNVLEKSQLGLFRSLLFQLFQQSRQIFQRFMPTFRRKVDFYDGEWTWNEQELKALFMSVMTELSPSSAYIFIDALHECREAREIIAFFESLRATAFQNKVPVRICYSSRHYPHIQVGDHVELHIDTHNNDDIEKYIERKLEPIFQRRHIAQLKSYIIEKAQGVFLWVVLIVSKIIKANDNGESMKKMRQMVEDVPDKLEALYRETLETVKTEHPAETLLILQWMLCATRPITLLELRYALAFQDSKYNSQAEAEDCLSFIESDQQMDLLHRARTGGLTETRTQTTIKTNYARQILDGSNQITVHFVHESVRGFLLKHDGLELFDSVSAQETLRRGEHQLAEACINYLNTTELRRVAESYFEPDVLGLTKSVELFQQLCRLYPFLHYSLHSVFKHIKAAEIGQPDGKSQPSYLHQRMEEVFFIWRYLSDLDNKSRFHEVHGTRATLVHLAAEHNMVDWVKYYLARDGDVNVVGGRFGTLLQAATVMGHDEMVNLLLEFGADVHIDAGRFGTAMNAAAWLGNLAIIRSLIQRGSDVNDQCGDYGYPLQAAACSPNGSGELIHTLLDAGADIHMQAGRHGTALQAGAYKGDEEIVQALLARGADMNAQYGEHGTALGAAAFQGHEQIVQVFLEHGADPRVEAGDCGNAIWAAAYNGQERVLRQILRRRWPTWEQDQVESEVQKILSKATRTKAFHEAVENGDFDLVKKFIGDGIDPNARGEDFSSALHTAAVCGHVNIVALLLSHEHIKLDVSDSRGRTPLWQAASNGHLEITRKLLDTGRVDCRHKSHSGRNLLWFAAHNGNMDIIRMVWEAGADPYEADDYGMTPVLAAEEEGQKEVLLLFQEHMKQ
ncbi:ankyrin repeat-containing domain protein [Aspergillus tamarii]|uniref:Ankyrin repeat-containing domain protein n=1 Tax=Aspergillus tamarii TaxID=41984 RepID=A0A5N6UTH4_ASPTM|nr:ankyrin repeat-containing domain protein [Aspergillus tamarii]